MNAVIKIVLAVLCFVCLADMPYGYYQFVRIAGLIGFAVLAYLAAQNKNQLELILFVGLACLFQPFYKVALGREMWNIVDVIVGAGLTISVLYNLKNENQSKRA